MEQFNIVKQLLHTLNTKQTKDYLSLAFFFLVFAVFIGFAIRPSLTTAFSLKKEEGDLQRINDTYEQVISSIVANQTIFETTRDKLPLVDEAIPKEPRINNLIGNIEQSARENSVVFSKVNVGEVSLVEGKEDQLKSVIIQIEANSSFENLLKFVEELFSQRRIKFIKALEISKQEEISTGSAQLEIKIQVEGYHL